MSCTDDGSILDSWSLLRRVHRSQVVPDGNTGKSRVSSGAFKDPEMSVDVEEILQASGSNWRKSLEGYEGYSLVRFPAAHPRKLGLPVCHKPLPDNSAHAEVHGKKTGSIANKFVEASDWVHLV